MKTDRDGSLIALSNRAVNYGDGCFTTIALFSGVMQLLDLHIARLKQDCQRLAIRFVHFELLNSQLVRVAKENPIGRHVVKVLISRGDGGRGYSPSGCTEPQFYISIHSFPAHYTDWQNLGINIGVASLKLGKQPILGGIKHLNRLEQVLIKQELDSLSVDDLLVLDSDSQVIEASAANVFWYSNQSGWETPKINDAGVEGVMRHAILSFMQEQGLQVKLGHYQLDRVVQADAVFLCNSLMAIVPVLSMQVSEQRIHFNPNKVTRLAAEFNHWMSTT